MIKFSEWFLLFEKSIENLYNAFEEEPEQDWSKIFKEER